MKFTSNPENVAAIERIADALRALPVGATAPYAELDRAAGRGRSVRSSHRHLLEAAREAVEKEDGSRIESVRGVGVKKLEASAMTEMGATHVRRTRRAALRGIKRLTGIAANLSEKERATIVAQRTVLGVAANVATMNAVKTVAADVTSVAKEKPQNIAEIVKAAMAQR